MALGNPGETGELTVWDAVRRAFAGRECLGYWRFPIFAKSSGESRKEPDILLIDKELGLVVIEVKSFRLEQLSGIDGHRWRMRDFYRDSIEPYQQAENQLFALLGFCDQEPPLRRRVPGRVLVALPWVHSDAWLERGFDALPSCPPVIFEDNLGKSSLLNTVRDTPPVVPGCPITDEMFELLLQTIVGSGVYRKPVREDRVVSGRAKVVLEAREALHAFDIQQETIAKQIPPGPQRIRGIAGSGKTVLLCQKAAQMHLKHPDWDIALVFFTRSLYDVIVSTIDKWMRRFTGGDLGYDPANSKLRVLHAWGAKNQPGFYSTVSRAHGLVPLNAGQTPKGHSPTESYAFVVKNLLETLAHNNQDIKGLFDALLVDEGQDLVFEERFKFGGKQPFYHLAYKTLRPVEAAAQAQALFAELERDPSKSSQRRLIWAYDEAQSLDSLMVPSYREIFGEQTSQEILSGGVSYTGGIAKNEVMERCYRTPGTIITAAHAIGMGLLRPEGMLSGITTREGWAKLGYEIEGDFRRLGSTIRLHRPEANSPNRVPELYKKAVLTFHTLPSRADEIEMVAEQLKQDIQQEGSEASRDLLVIALGNTYEAGDLQKRMAGALESHGIPYFVPGATVANVLNPQYPHKDANRFWCDGAVTISKIHQAKGNEADIVYILGFDHIARRESDINYRNQTFVALTRTRGWAHLSGVGADPLFEEMRTVIRSGSSFSFTFQRPPKRELND